MNLKKYTEKLPEDYYICEKRLWVGNTAVDIDHIDNDLNKPLNYEKAFKEVLKKIPPEEHEDVRFGPVK